jgi:hypothetical protein
MHSALFDITGEHVRYFIHEEINPGEYRMKSIGPKMQGGGFLVRLKERFCECMEYSDKQYPCIHGRALVLGLSTRKELNQLMLRKTAIDERFWISNIKKAIENLEHRTPSQETLFVDHEMILPKSGDPLPKKKKGRPNEEQRNKSNGE